MGVNNQTPGQTSPYAGMQPAQAQGAQQINALQRTAMTPYQGGAPGGGGSQAVAQLVAALLARQKQKQWQQQYGIGNQTPQPGMAGPQAASTPTPALMSQGPEDSGT